MLAKKNKRKRSYDVNIPIDLTLQILKKLPAKSIARFRCVSKEWETIINDCIVKNSIVTRSSTDQPPHDAPHYILIRWVDLVFSFTYPNQISVEGEQQLYREEIFRESKYTTRFQYVRGLIGFESYEPYEFTIHNPTTKQSVSLPNTDMGPGPGPLYYLFGYDPLLNQYKVVCLTTQSYKVFTIGDLENRWRNIQCRIVSHYPIDHSIVCINGIIYYKARLVSNLSDVIVGFDVMSELFNQIETPKEVTAQSGFSNLVNYQGKLGCIHPNAIKTEDMDVWVMENVEKQEWSKITYFDVLKRMLTHIRFDVTHHDGKIVIFNPFTLRLGSVVYYYDPKVNIRTRVQIQTAASSESEHVRLLPVTDHVENIMCLSLI